MTAATTRSMAVQQTISKAFLAVQQHQNILSNCLLGGYLIDEVALMVESAVQLRGLYEELENLGWRNFNEARDIVRTNPIQSQYAVRYHFFGNPDVPWRLEVMQMEEGVSPLHSALAPATDLEVCRLVHASFKVDSSASYGIVRSLLSQSPDRLVECQRCESTYGRFSYWRPSERNDLFVSYLKPRVNLRDSVL